MHNILVQRILGNPYRCLFIIFLFIIFLRIPLAPVPLFNVDEAVNAVAGNVILDGGVIYRDVMDLRGPVTSYFFSLIFMLFGRNNMTAVHIALTILIFAIAVILYFIGTLIKDKKTGCLAALFFGVFSYTYENLDMLAFHTEWVAIFFTSLGAYFFLKYTFKKEYLSLLLSGLSFGLAFFSKQPSLFDCLITLLFLCIFEYSHKKDKGALIRPLLIILFGFFIIAVIFVSYFYFNNALKDFWFCFWIVGTKYYVPVIPVSKRIIHGLLSPLQPGSFLQINYLLSICFIIACIESIFKSFKKPRPLLFVDSYFILWGIFSYLGVNYSGRSYGHYFIMILPAFCIIAAKMISGLFVSVVLRRNIKIFLLLAVIIGCVHPLIRYSHRMKIWKAYLGRNKIKVNFISEELSPVVSYIKTNSRQSDKIFVWGFVPEIYVFTGRMPASKYIYNTILTSLAMSPAGKTTIDASYTLVPKAWGIFIAELERNSPKFIIDTNFGGISGFKNNPPTKFKELSDFLNKSYIIRKDFFLNGDPTFRVYEKVK